MITKEKHSNEQNKEEIKQQSKTSKWTGGSDKIRKWFPIKVHFRRPKRRLSCVHCTAVLY